MMSDSSPNALTRLSLLLKEDLNATDILMQQELISVAPLIPQLGKYTLDAGGKRIRPLLTLAIAALYHIQGQAPRQLAAAVEFIHTATLLHDDVVDDGHLRRGKPAARQVWGNEASVLVGDFLFARAFVLMTQTGNQQVLHILSGASATIAEGEVMQLAAQHHIETTIEQYYRIIHAKTATLFRAACMAAQALGDASLAEQQALYTYGEQLGLAFQLSDDVLDYLPDTLGKEAGNDWTQGKVTLPLLLLWQAMDGTEKDDLKGHWAKAEYLGNVLELFKKYRILEQAAEQAAQAAHIASKALDALPQHEIMTPLLRGLSEDVGKRAKQELDFCD
jgi:octaprenyl-diphosphate synthase